MGKSWLLTELARRLSLTAKPASLPVDVPHLFAPPSCLVGTFELQADKSDFLLRAVVDLYSRWLSDSTYLQQAQATYQLQKKDLIGRTGEAVGSIFEAISKVVFPLEGVGKLVKGIFDGLATANRDLLTGGPQLARLQIDQARELLELVNKITNYQLVLIFDQWEKSLKIEEQAGILDTFVRHVDEWPSCHIFLGMRPDGKPSKAIKEILKLFPGIVENYDLPPMHLDDPTSKSDLLRSLRGNVAAAASVSDEDLLNAISGYPGTLAQWTSNFYAKKLRTLQDFQKVAADANASRFAEFETLLPDLSDSERRLSIRLALLPATSNAEDWAALRTVVLEDIQAKDLDSLKRSGVIELISPPTYGHAKRKEAALQWFTGNSYEELREICELLIFSLGGHIQEIKPSEVPYVGSLIALEPVASKLDLPIAAQGVCQAALSLYDARNVVPDKLVAAAAELSGMKPAHASVIPLLAVSLLNTLNAAEAEGRATDRSLALLDELRRLFRAYPQIPVVREQLANGLFNSLIGAQEQNMLDRRDQLLDELRQLCSAYPDDAPVRQQLMKGLFNTLIAAKEEQKSDRRHALLDELRQLSQGHRDDALVRELLARGLFNSLNAAIEDQDTDRRDRLLAELEQLGAAFPGDTALRERLVKGLFNTLIGATAGRAFDRGDKLLDALRGISRAHPEDTVAREQLGIGVFNMLKGAMQAEALHRIDLLTAELRDLRIAYPEDTTLRQLWAISLFQALANAQAPDTRDLLLAQLWRLHHDYPNDTTVRQWLAKGLLASLVNAKDRNALGRRDELLDTLRYFAGAHPGDAAPAEQLATGLFNTMFDAKEEGVPERFPLLLDELRNLYRAHPQHAFVRQWLAKAVARTLGIPGGYKQPREDALLDELRQLLRADPDDPVVRQLVETVDT